MKNFRRITAALCVLAMLFSLCACAKHEKYEAVFITDVGDIYDRSYNSVVWDGVKSYAADYGVSCKYYRPSQRGTTYFFRAIRKAIKHGAKAVVCHGDEFRDAVVRAAERWEDVKFIIVDSTEKDLPDNVLAVSYSTLDAGYLAGYASVFNGFQRLGFQGSYPSDNYVNYCFGFIQGAERAAEDMNLGAVSVDIKVRFLKTDETELDAEARAKLWYSTGTQAIFACGTKVFAAVASAAERNIGSWVIGADTDKSYVSDAVLTTAEKSVSMSVYRALESVKNGSFSGGRSVKFGIADDGVRLDLSRSAFNLFTQSDYDAIVARIKADPTMISSLVTADDAKSTVLGDESELSSLFSLNCVILSTN